MPTVQQFAVFILTSYNITCIVSTLLEILVSLYLNRGNFYQAQSQGQDKWSKSLGTKSRM